MRVDGLERLGEFPARNLVDLLNRLLRVAYGIDQVLPLRGQEIQALLRFLELLQRGGIYRSQRFDPLADLDRRPLGFFAGGGLGNRVVRRGQFLHRAVQIPSADLVQILQLGLLADQFDLNPRSPFEILLNPDTQEFQRFLALAQPFAHRRFPQGHLRDAGFQFRDLDREFDRSAVQFDVVGQQSYPLLAQPLDLRSQRRAPRADLAELLFQTRHGRPLAAAPLLDARQLGANLGVLFADRRRLPVQLFQFLALVVERLLAIRAGHLLRLDRGQVPFALLGRLGRVAVQPLQFQTRHRDPRVGARQILAQLPYVVIQRHPVLFARLLRRAQPFHFAFQTGDLPAQPFQARQLIVERILTALEFDRQLARFAFHGQRSRDGSLAAGDCVAVIAEALRQQEIQVRIARRQALRRRAVLRTC